MAVNWDNWGHLRSRYETPGPRRMLTLDGGGIYGLLSIQVVKRLETMLAQHYYPSDEETRKSFRLCQFFDYIGGTSTGSIIAAGLARGMSAAEIESFYLDFGTKAFSKEWLYNRWKNLYEDGPLTQKLQEVFSSTPPGGGAPELETLDPRYLQTLLLVVTKNQTTDSAWPISSNPSAKYNDPTRADCNLRIPLWQIVRASTAAPVYFPPEVVQWDKSDPRKSFVFVDGGTTPYNDPAFLIARMATESRYRLAWQTGEDKLLVVSIGTGWKPISGTTPTDPEDNILSSAKRTLTGLMRQAQVDQDINCRTIGRCTYGDVLDREIGDLIPSRNGTPIPLSEDQGRNFLYARYDAELTDTGLRQLGVSGIAADSLGGMDDVAAIPKLVPIGEALAKRVNLAHFGRFCDLPLWVSPGNQVRHR